MKLQTKVLERDDPRFPESLKSIHDPPKRLHYYGDLSMLKKRRIAVVGSRKYTLYGKVMAKTIGRTLGEAGLSIISGLAFGIDAFAHEGTREAGGNAIAVLGMGINRFGPASNRELFEWVCETGLVLSEYEDDIPASQFTFPARNRLISGLSENVILVEAGFKSGALITANYALEQGRGVYAVPGNVNSQFSLGTNLLIRDGARPLIVIDDILRDMGIGYDERTDRPAPDIGPDELPVYRCIEQSTGITIDEIVKQLGIEAGRAGSIATILEIKGLIMSCAGKLYLAN